jgi:hypothetical protein
LPSSQSAAHSSAGDAKSFLPVDTFPWDATSNHSKTAVLPATGILSTPDITDTVHLRYSRDFPGSGRCTESGHPGTANIPQSSLAATFPYRRTLAFVSKALNATDIFTESQLWAAKLDNEETPPGNGSTLLLILAGLIALLLLLAFLIFIVFVRKRRQPTDQLDMEIEADTEPWMADESLRFASWDGEYCNQLSPEWESSEFAIFDEGDAFNRNESPSAVISFDHGDTHTEENPFFVGFGSESEGLF